MPRLRPTAPPEHARLLELLAHLPVLLAVFEGPDYVCVFANPAYEAVAGHRPLIGRPLRDAFPELADQPAIIALLDHVYATRQPTHGSEMPVALVRDGQRHPGWFNYVVQPAIQDGVVTSILVAAMEVTDTVRARHAAETAAQRTAALQSITTALAIGLAPAEVAQVIVDHCAGILNASASGIYLPGDSRDELSLIAAKGYSPEVLSRWGRLAVDAPLPVPAVFRDQVPLWVTSRAELVGQFPLLDLQRMLSPYEAIAVLPLLAHGQTLGVLFVSFRDPRDFSPSDRDFLLAVAHQCAQAIERARLFAAEHKVRQALEDSHALLHAVIEGSPDGLFMKDLQGRYVMINTRDAVNLGYRPADMIGKRDDELLDSALAAAVLVHDRQIMTTGQSRSFEYHVNVQGQTRILSSHKSPHRDRHGEIVGLIGVVRDITELRRAEQTQRFLAEMSKVLSSSLEETAIFDAIVRRIVPELADYAFVHLVDEQGRLTAVAQAHVDPAREPLLRALWDEYQLQLNDPVSFIAQALRDRQPRFVATFAPDAWSGHPPAVRRRLAELKPRSGMVVPLLSRGRLLGGLSLVYAESGQHYTADDLALLEELAQRAALAIDNARLYSMAQSLNQALEQRVQARTAELEASREELRQLSGRLEALREEERGRIAREVHDELGGSLTALKMDVVRLRRSATAPSAERLQALEHSIDDTVQTVRRIATELRPALLDDFGLVAAIDWQLQEFARRTGLECALTTSLDSVPLDRDSATAVFRVFQEALTNVARHADASRVDVVLTEARDGLCLEVRDNGRGLDLAQLKEARSFGLLGMRERMRLLKGELELSSRPQAGTVVTVRVPYPAA